MKVRPLRSHARGWITEADINRARLRTTAATDQKNRASNEKNGEAYQYPALHLSSHLLGCPSLQHIGNTRSMLRMFNWSATSRKPRHLYNWRPSRPLSGRNNCRIRWEGEPSFGSFSRKRTLPP